MLLTQKQEQAAVTKRYIAELKRKQEIDQTFHSFHTGSSSNTCAYIKSIILASEAQNDITQLRTANY